MGGGGLRALYPLDAGADAAAAAGAGVGVGGVECYKAVEGSGLAGEPPVRWPVYVAGGVPGGTAAAVAGPVPAGGDGGGGGGPGATGERRPCSGFAGNPERPPSGART